MINPTFTDRLLLQQPRLLNYAMILTSDREQAYALLQESTLKALELADEFDDTVSFSRWANNLMRSIYVAKYRHPAARAPRVRLALAADEGADIPQGSCTVAEINRRLERVDQPGRRIVAMWLVGYTEAEISAELRVERRVVVRSIRAFR